MLDRGHSSSLHVRDGGVQGIILCGLGFQVNNFVCLNEIGYSKSKTTTPIFNNKRVVRIMNITMVHLVCPEGIIGAGSSFQETHAAV